LAEAQGQAEGLLRVSRAQSEEIEELRGRVRRSAEARADLDEEAQRLRRALLEADESVVNLTRKTADEMTVLAQRLTAGLRPERATARRRSGRGTQTPRGRTGRTRIGAVGTRRSHRGPGGGPAGRAWRAEAAEDDLGRLRTQIADIRQAPLPAIPDELLATLKSREQALEEFQRAAAAHLDEAGRLRDALNEQSSLVAELEEDLATAEKRLADAPRRVGAAAPVTGRGGGGRSPAPLASGGTRGRDAAA
jgi:predicted  nucleic acid-binding Zn-ribbon protein